MLTPERGVVVVGNGPLSSQQRAFIRAAKADDVYRFNGMANLLPDEPVGHLYARRVDDVTADYGIGVGNLHHEYAGMQPPLSMAGLLEVLIAPTFVSRHMRTRSMCHRAHEAVDVGLLGGTETDATFYEEDWSKSVQQVLLSTTAIELALTRAGIARDLISALLARMHAGSTVSSGLIGILDVLHRRPGSIVHILGMNFAKSSQEHLHVLEREIVRQLVNLGKVALHPPPSRLYRTVSRVSTLFMHDMRVQGLSCGQWDHWWCPQWRIDIKKIWQLRLLMPEYDPNAATLDAQPEAS